MIFKKTSKHRAGQLYKKASILNDVFDVISDQHTEETGRHAGQGHRRLGTQKFEFGFAVKDVHVGEAHAGEEGRPGRGQTQFGRTRKKFRDSEEQIRDGDFEAN